MKTVLVMSFSDLGSDPRVHRQLRALSASYDVIAAGTGPPVVENIAFIALPTHDRSLPGRAAGLARLVAHRYDDVYWSHPTNREALARVEEIGADVIVANELAALPIALRLGAPVVFDAHEYSPEEFGDRWWWRRVIRPYARWQCRRYIPEAAAMTTVGQAIADAYRRDLDVRPTVIANAPAYADLEPTPPHAPIRILHHGGALRGRGLEELVRLGSLLDERFTLDLVLVEGTPGLRSRLIDVARGNDRVRFPRPVPMRDIVRMANEYDIGVYSLPPINSNQRLALPNKLFEFIQARLAVAIGPSPAMAEIVRGYGCGVIADDFSAEALAAAINGLDAASIASLKAAAHDASAELCAERNEALLLDVVRDALLRPARHASASVR